MMNHNSSFIKVLGTGSVGNCYLIQAEGESLLLECGMSFKKILKGLDFKISDIKGCLLSHHHKDHSKAYAELLANGIDLYSNKQTLEELGVIGQRRTHILKSELIRIGGFSVFPFEGVHTNNDGSNCEVQSFLIHHKDLGKIVFITDSFYTGYKLFDVQHILIEANYSEDILEGLEEHRARIIKSHMSLETCKKTLSSWDLSKTKDITLIHISSTNGEADRYKKEVEELTGIKTNIAERGFIIYE